MVSRQRKSCCQEWLFMWRIDYRIMMKWMEHSSLLIEYIHFWHFIWCSSLKYTFWGDRRKSEKNHRDRTGEILWNSQFISSSLLNIDYLSVCGMEGGIRRSEEQEEWCHIGEIKALKLKTSVSIEGFCFASNRQFGYFKHRGYSEKSIGCVQNCL